MTRRTISTLVLVSVVPLLASAAHGQPTLRLAVGPTVGIGSAEGPVQDGSVAIAGEADAEYAFGDRGRVFYRLDAGAYPAPGDWRTYLHEAGVARRFGEGGRRLHLLASVALRHNGSAWEEAGWRGLSLAANGELGTDTWHTLRLGYRFDARSFGDLPELDQRQHEGFASLLLNLPTRTTLIGELRVGGKTYDGNAGAADHSAGYAPSLPAGRGGGPGSGRYVPLVSPAASGPAAAPTGSAGIVSGVVRVAQSLRDRTGVYVQYSVRSRFGVAVPLVVTTPPLFLGDGVYDDPYASDLHGWQVTARHAFASGASLEATFNRDQEDFPDVVARDSSGIARADGRLRADTVCRWWVGGQVPVLSTRATDVSVQAGYDFLERGSSDAFSSYRSHGLLARVVVDF